MRLAGPGRVAAALLPVALALGIALALGWMRWPGAVLALAGAAAGTLLLTLPVRRDAAAVEAYLRRLADEDGPAPEPRVGTATARGLMVSAGRLHDRWRRRAEAQARQLDAARAIPATLRDPIVVVERDLRVAAVNPAAAGLFGDRMVGRDLSATIRNPAVLQAVEDVLAGRAPRQVEYAPARAAGRVYELWVLPVHGAEGGVVLSLHDMTQQRRIERMRADFVANASHELRTPLSTLLGFIETLRGPARDDADARERFLAVMHDQAARMTRLVSDLLSLSRIEVDEHVPPTGRVELAAVARAVVAALELKARQRTVRLVLDAAPDLPAVPGDEDQLTQVAQNLIDNAVKYTRPDTDVTVTLAPHPDGVALSVRDRGEGIAPEHLPRLTERFYRVDPARSRALGGTGLGLAIVKHIVARHHGRLDIASTPGEGSVFTVVLPRVKS